jgi:hypothetical protein
MLALFSTGITIRWRMSFMKLICNDEKTGYVKDFIQSAFKEFSRATFFTGYYSNSGLRLIDGYIRDFLNSGSCTLKILVGMHAISGITAENLQSLHNLNTIAYSLKSGKEIDPYGIVRISKEEYHGKSYVFENEKNAAVLIGSSNFTEPGFLTRRETNILLNGSRTELSHIISQLQTLWNDSIPLHLAKLGILKYETELDKIAEADIERGLIDDKFTPEEIEKGDYVEFTITLNNLNEGGRPRIGEAYLNAGSVEKNEFFGGKGNPFMVLTDDEMSFEAAISGWGGNPDIGKNLRSRPSNKMMGDWLKERKEAKPGDKVKAYKISPGYFYFEYIRS